MGVELPFESFLEVFYRCASTFTPEEHVTTTNKQNTLIFPALLHPCGYVQYHPLLWLCRTVSTQNNIKRDNYHVLQFFLILPNNLGSGWFDRCKATCLAVMHASVLGHAVSRCNLLNVVWILLH